MRSGKSDNSNNEDIWADIVLPRILSLSSPSVICMPNINESNVDKSYSNGLMRLACYFQRLAALVLIDFFKLRVSLLH
jgi:hypothetical protein